METYQQQRQKIIQLFQQVQAIVQQNQRQDISKVLSESAQRLIEGKLFVVIAGEFKKGKSSLINALINETDLFPVDIDITTSLVSTITYGKQEKITVILGEPGKGKEKVITREEIPNYVTEQGNANNARKAQMLVIESPNPQLKEGLVLVDTPGVGGLNTEHTAVSYAFIPNADVILFVSDTQKPLAAKELEFVEMINRHCQTFLFVVTKKDLGNYQDIINSNREKLSQTLNLPETKLSIIPVSSKTKLAYLKSHDAEDLEDSNFQALETTLWQILEQQRGNILNLRALADLGKAISQIKTPIQVEWEASQQTPAKLAEIQAEFQQTKDRFQNLLNNDAIWRTQLIDGLQDIRTQTLEIFQDGFAEINRQVNVYTDNPSFLENPAQILSLLEVDIDSLMSGVGQQLSYLAADLQGRIESSTGLDLDLSEFDSLSKVKTKVEDFQFKNQAGVNKLLQVTRTATFNMSAAATIGGLAGGVVGSFFGGVGAAPGYYVGAAIGGGLASIAGLVTGAMEGMSQQKEKSKLAILQTLRPFITESQTQCNRTLNQAIKELERSMRNELTTKIQQEKETCDRTLRSLKESQQRTQEETKKKIAELKPILEKIGYLEQEITKLTQQLLSKVDIEPIDPSSEKYNQVTRYVSNLDSQKDTGDDGDWADE